jgi:hypothetical protein
MTTDDKYKNLDRVNFWVSNCDSKVSYLLTLQGIVLTIIFTSRNATACLLTTLSYKFSCINFGWKSIFRFLEGVSLYLFLAFIFISLFHAYHTLRARLDPKIFKQNGLETKSILFFETIANRKFSDFVNDQLSQTENQLNNDIDSQIFINSKICQQKFKHYNLTVKYYSWGFISGLLYLILTIKC